MWRIQYPYVRVKVLTYLDFSYHHPILVYLTDHNGRIIVKYLKYECVWVLEDTYENMMEAVWDETNNLDLEFACNKKN